MYIVQIYSSHSCVCHISIFNHELCKIRERHVDQIIGKWNDTK